MAGAEFLMKEVTLGHRNAFFDVNSVNDVIEVWLNEQHPAFEHLIEVLAGRPMTNRPSRWWSV